MSKRKYPYLSDKRRYKTNKLCCKCKKHNKGYVLTWQVSWFRGDDEVEKVCDDCAKVIFREEEKREKKQEDYEHRQFIKRIERNERLKKRLEENYEVRCLTDYQWRINGVIDIFITNRRYHDLRVNKRGGYSDLHSFLNGKL